MLSLVVTGSPGVGKHTVARGIAGRMDLSLLDLNRAAAEEGALVEGSGQVDVGVLGRRIRPRLEERSLVVGHLAPYVLTRSQVRMAIILRRDPYRLAAVYKRRGYSEGKTRDNLGSEILGITAHDMIRRVGAARAVQVDTTGKSVPEVILQAGDAIDGRGTGDPVDWLSLVAGRNDLGRFFSYH